MEPSSDCIPRTEETKSTTHIYILMLFKGVIIVVFKKNYKFSSYNSNDISLSHGLSRRNSS